MSNQICLKKETFDHLLSLALANCGNSHVGGGNSTANYKVCKIQF